MRVRNATSTEYRVPSEDNDHSVLGTRHGPWSSGGGGGLLDTMSARRLYTIVLMAPRVVEASGLKLPSLSGATTPWASAASTAANMGEDGGMSLKCPVLGGANFQL